MTNQTLVGINLPAPTKYETKVDPAALGKLFDADPEELSEQDIETICVELRAQRARFELDETAKAMKPKEKKAPAVLISKEKAEQLSLDDLGL